MLEHQKAAEKTAPDKPVRKRGVAPKPMQTTSVKKGLPGTEAKQKKFKKVAKKIVERVATKPDALLQSVPKKPRTLRPPYRPPPQSLSTALLPHQKAKLSEYNQIVGPGNELRIIFSQDYGFEEPFIIDRKGFLDVPEIGPQQVAGMRLNALESMLKEKLGAYFKQVDGLQVRLIKQDKYVRVVGAVNEPGLLTISKHAGLDTVLAKAKGVKDGADLSHVLIMSVRQEKQWVDYAKFLVSGDPNDLPQVAPGSYVFVPLKAPARLVTVQGFVVQAGSYRWSPDKTLLDYIADAKGLRISDGARGLPNVGAVQIFRYDAQIESFKTFYVDLVGLLEEGGRLDDMPKLLPGDSVYIPNTEEYWFINPRIVYIFGEVKKPGRFRYSKQQSFLDIITEAGGFTDDADSHDIHVIDQSSGRPMVRHYNLQNYFSMGDRSSLPQLLPGYVVFVPSVKQNYLDVKDDRFVMVMGSVEKPGRYEFSVRKSIMDLLVAAGGVKDSAVISNVIILNRSDKDISRARSFDLYKYLRTGDSDLLPVLRPGDLVYVPSNLHPKAHYYTGLFGTAVAGLLSLSLLGGT